MVELSKSERVELCPREARPEALAVLYQRIDAELRDYVVADALAEADRGALDLSGLWIAHRRGRIVGALLTHGLAGRACAIWAPEVIDGWGRAAHARRLLTTALGHLSANGYRIAQALVGSDSPPRTSTDLARAGLAKITELLYLERDTLQSIELRPTAVSLSWTPFSHETEADFREILQATYVGTLDMPELEGVRSLDDIIAGHRAAGRFDPSRWLLGRVVGEPDAALVALLSEVVDRDAWEVAYLGLTPAARGRGLGRAALEFARNMATGHASRLELAVDARNTPALRLYDETGFRVFDRRVVHLALLRKNDTLTGRAENQA